MPMITKTMSIQAHHGISAKKVKKSFISGIKIQVSNLLFPKGLT